ncbi:MAG: uroporphyrinogen-III synthase, partial [Proteobacteria bacterium]|nr:uroporphyrinogen-III synthase [Pseudomonadota bacterium]
LKKKIIITGEHNDSGNRYPASDKDGNTLLWQEVPVLDFERLPIESSLLKSLAIKPFDWIIFTSVRAVRFWSEILLEEGVDFPVETQVACIGETTAHAAQMDGFTPDFFPTEPGSEKFLEEFEELLSNRTDKPRVLIPASIGGRTMISDRLRELGCEVERLSVYKTMPRQDIQSHLSQKDLEDAALVLFTSPSSVDAVSNLFDIQAPVKVGSMGSFTQEHLEKKGVSDVLILPEGDFQKVGEILC